ncbi:ParA family protein [Natrinema sp. DC36]|uniref:ParA family protein n=1 Tax=Natrinema sp. DC36 TaxID=2878680 RepID=UPI001CF09702|nr:ParA family protein [Natrinema sp. DC36]
MLTYTVYSEAGGVGKSSLTASLAAAHARGELNVLAVPLDPQDGDLSRLLGVDVDRAEKDADNLVRHMVNAPKGPFEDLIRTAEGVDIVPEHNMLSDLASHLDREQQKAEDFGDAYNVHAQLQRVLQEAGVGDHYDVVICDPPAMESPHLYNAIYATRNLVIPVEPSAKGDASVTGLEELASNFADKMNIEVGVLAAVPNGFKGTNDQKELIDEISFPTPEIIGDRTSLMEGCWKQQCSAFTYEREHRDYPRDHELETLAQFDRLARYLEEQRGIEAPNPPEPGTLDHEVDA